MRLFKIKTKKKEDLSELYKSFTKVPKRKAGDFEISVWHYNLGKHEWYNKEQQVILTNKT